MNEISKFLNEAFEKILVANDHALILVDPYLEQIELNLHIPLASFFALPFLGISKLLKNSMSGMWRSLKVLLKL